MYLLTTSCKMPALQLLAYILMLSRSRVAYARIRMRVMRDINWYGWHKHMQWNMRALGACIIQKPMQSDDVDANLL